MWYCVVKWDTYVTAADTFRGLCIWDMIQGNIISCSWEGLGVLKVGGESEAWLLLD